MFYNPNHPATQTCRQCAKPMEEIGARRPREFCSNKCRQAAYRANSVTPPSSTYKVLPDNEPTIKSGKNRSEKSNDFKGRFVTKFGPSIPLNLLGGHRWKNGTGSDERAAKIRAAIDAEIGVGGIGEMVVSPEGVRCWVIPSRRQRGGR